MEVATAANAEYWSVSSKTGTGPYNLLPLLNWNEINKLHWLEIMQPLPVVQNNNFKLRCAYTVVTHIDTYFLAENVNLLFTRSAALAFDQVILREIQDTELFGNKEKPQIGNELLSK